MVLPFFLAGFGALTVAHAVETSGPCWCTIENSMGAGKYTYSLADAGVPIVHVSGPLTPSADCPAWSSGTYRFDNGEEQPITLGTGYFRDIEVPPLMREGGHTLAITCWGANVGGGSEFHQESLEVVVDNTPPSMTITKPADWAILPGKAGSVTYGGAISDNNEDPRVSLYQFALWATTPDRIYPFPYVIATGAGSWQFQFPMTDIPGFSLPGSYHLQSYFEAKDGAGNATTGWVCEGPTYCRQDESLRRDLIIDGTPPQVWIDAPSENAVLSSLAAISGTADDQSETGWGTQLKRVLLEVRRNSTGETILSADIPVSGSTAAWSHTVDDGALAHLSSYTIVVRAEDAMENMSAPVERTFTFDLCFAEPVFPADRMGTVAGRVSDDPDYFKGCSVFMCSRSVPFDQATGFYEMYNVTPPQYKSGVRVFCDDQERQCPLPSGGARNDTCGGGGFKAKRGDKQHNAIDWSLKREPDGSVLPENRIVRSATLGTVVFVGQAGWIDLNVSGSYGWIVVVRSQRKVEGRYEYVFYAHLKPPRPSETPLREKLVAELGGVEETAFAEPRVRAGDMVFPGQAIGDADNTGNATTCKRSAFPDFKEHLHTAAWHSTEDVDITRNPDPQVVEGYAGLKDRKKAELKQPRFDMTLFLDPKKSQPKNPDELFGCDKFGGTR